MTNETRHNDKNGIKDLIDIFLRKYKLSPGLLQIKVEKAWAEQMGKGVNAYTEKIILRNSTLYVYLTSATLREELNYGKDKIITLLNEALEAPVIEKIILK